MLPTHVNLPDRGLTHRFAADSLEIGTVASYSICRWKHVRIVRRVRHGWTFYVGPNRFMIVTA